MDIKLDNILDSKKEIMLEKSLKVKDFTFGDGTPRICVPITGRTGEEIFAMAIALRGVIDRLDAAYPDRPDLRIAVIEWRADYYLNINQPQNVFNILRHLRSTFKDRIVLFTFRSEEQGGVIRNDRFHMQMEEIMRNVVSSGLVDMVDVEAAAGNYNIARATTRLHEGGVKVVLSYHDFLGTPHDVDIEEKLRQMDILGGDILKMAFMPKNQFDTRRIMELNQRMVIERSKPVALISMGVNGMASRVRGKQTGCALTFAAVGGQESAPGQLEVSELIEMMSKL